MFARKLFLLSPASCSGRRAQMLLNGRSSFDLAQRVRAGGAPLGEIFAFLSGLYFRGKLAYARRFAAPPPSVEGGLIITSNRGLVPAGEPFDLEQLRALGEVPIDARDLRYRQPLERDLRVLASRHPECHVVLLGSVASDKYVDILLEVLGSRLHFPIDFAGRGDMSRGGLMLRCVESGAELTYAPLSGAMRHGKRPPKLTQITPRRTAPG